MGANKSRLLAALEATTLRPADQGVLDRYAGTRKVLVITEDWCGTSLAVLPVVFKLAEANPQLELRVLLRDENPEVMDDYLKDGRHRSIPVVVFFGEAFNELARFIERRPA